LNPGHRPKSKRIDQEKGRRNMKIYSAIVVLCFLFMMPGCNSYRNPWLEKRIEKWKSGSENDKLDALYDISTEGLFKISEKDSFALPFFYERFKKGDEAERETAIRSMGFIKNPDSLPYIKQGLKDESDFVRDKAIWALSQFDDSEKTALLIPLLEDRNFLVRQRAAHTLKPMVKEEKVLKRIHEILNNPPVIKIDVKDTKDSQELGKAVFDALRKEAEKSEKQHKSDKLE
jgi:hypothetical protein